MFKPSKRAQATIASPIRKFLPLADAAEKRGVKIFKLNIGQPDILPPASVKAEILKYLKNEPLIPYAPSAGYPGARIAWQKFYRDWGMRVKPEEIMVTTGASEAILLALLATCDQGDEAIIFEPCYSSYKSFAEMTGVRLRPVTLKLENNFRLPPFKVLEKQVSRKTKAIILINPGNPTGRVYNRQELGVIVRLAKKHGLFIIADETYRELTFTGRRAASFLDFPAVRNQLIVTDSVSKKFSACGARIGCLVCPNAEVYCSLLKFAQARLSAPTLDQLAFIPILKNSRAYIAKINREYRRRRDTVVRELQKIKGLTLTRPDATFYLMVGLSVKDSEDFAQWLLTKFSYRGKTVLATPAADFYLTPGLGRNEVRLAYVLNSKSLKEAMEVFRRGLEEYLKRSSKP
ncbi:MAG: pyridoxal phosphate-dependent aminotransferase [Patescibacteria group bacterium]|jgi:aspartate aminotransferase